uniref:Uncharacterized protein n=1 Tax=Arundo donax TaxID=35708 RepID=A0A0A8YBQ6_ARUDO
MVANQITFAIFLRTEIQTIFMQTCCYTQV